jgi:hypothetical protein
MRRRRFDLKTKSGGWTHHPDRWTEPDARMVDFTPVALRDGHPLGGHNIQAHVGTATRHHGPPDDVAIWLTSGWWVAFRNEFARAPQIATEIIASVEDELSVVTAALERARGPKMAEAKDRLWTMTFHAEGPDYWR